jgi:hypothetical protein
MKGRGGEYGNANYSGHKAFRAMKFGMALSITNIISHAKFGINPFTQYCSRVTSTWK